jgi:protein-tyrosine phosphatase
MNKEIEILCFFCRSKDNIKKCKDCRNSICNQCIFSQKTLSFVLRKHHLCVECESEICCYKTICIKCDIHPYHMINDKIAVGSSSSDYTNFDVIINLNYPENRVKENEIEYQKEKGKLIIKMGLSDSSMNDKEAYTYIINLIPVLYKYYRDKKILFHCFSGVSRSACFAISYLLYFYKMDIKDAYELVRTKRKFIKVNDGFMRSLENFSKYINSI